MGGVPFWVVSLLIPCIGLVICYIMWVAPAKAVMEVRRSESMGTLNPIPFPVTMMNCIGWVVYGCMIRDYFVFFANFPGLLLSTFYMLTTYPLANKIDREKMEAIILVGFTFWGSVGFIAGAIFGVSDAQRVAAAQFVGYLACFFALGYYSAGLSKFVEIIRERDSSSLHFPSILTNLTNALLWTIYGWFAVNDINLYLPNGVGVILSVIQLIFAMIFPRRKTANDLQNGGKLGNYAPQSVTNPLQEL